MHCEALCVISLFTQQLGLNWSTRVAHRLMLLRLVFVWIIGFGRHNIPFRVEVSLPEEQRNHYFEDVAWQPKWYTEGWMVYPFRYLPTQSLHRVNALHMRSCIRVKFEVTLSVDDDQSHLVSYLLLHSSSSSVCCSSCVEIYQLYPFMPGQHRAPENKHICSFNMITHSLQCC